MSSILPPTSKAQDSNTVRYISVNLGYFVIHSVLIANTVWFNSVPVLRIQGLFILRSYVALLYAVVADKPYSVVISLI